MNIRLLTIPTVLVSVALIFFAGCGSGVSPSDTSASAKLPRVAKVESMSSHYVEVTFVSPVGASAENPANYVIELAADGTPLAISSARRMADGVTVVLATDQQAEVEYRIATRTALAEKVDTTNYQVSGGNGLPPNPWTVFTGSTWPEPGVLAAMALSNTRVLVTFSERMEEAPAENLNYWRIGNPDLNITLAELDTAGRRVTLTTEPQRNIVYLVRVINLTRPNAIGGAFVDPYRSAAFFQGIPPTDNVGPQAVKAISLSTTSVAVYFSEPLEMIGADPLNFSIDNSLAVLDATFDDFGGVVFLTTTEQTPGTMYTVEAKNVRDLARNVIDPAHDTAMFEVVPGDDTAPEVFNAISTSLTTVLVSFTEPLAADAADPVKYQITPPLAVTNVELNGFMTQAMLTTQAQTPGVVYLVTVTGVKDPAGNGINTGANSAMFEVDPSDDSPPEVIKFAAANTTTVLVYFSEPMAATVIDPTKYEFDPSVIVRDAVLNASQTVVTLTTLPLTQFTTYTLSVTGVTDLAGNEISSTRGGVVIFDGSTSGTELARVVGAGSLHNKAVLVEYSKPMGYSAVNPANYIIVQENVNSEVGFLGVVSADWANMEHTAVGLITLPERGHIPSNRTQCTRRLGQSDGPAADPRIAR